MIPAGMEHLGYLLALASRPAARAATGLRTLRPSIFLTFADRGHDAAVLGDSPTPSNQAGNLASSDSVTGAVRSLATGRFGAQSIQGLRHRTPSGSKWRVLRVTTVMSLAWATAAISASSKGACSGTR